VAWGNNLREGANGMATVSRIVRVLVVEDFDRFRQFVCSTIATRSHLQIIGEASDGLEAVCSAEELQPELVLLDIGLPSLNGLAAAQRIRRVSPKSKIIFVTQESSPDVVQAALGTGASGYVVKTDANQLLTAVDTVLEGRQFVSAGLLARGVTTQSLPVSAD
jgi:DNA-binding NarL/FixJ family response regulator